MQIGFFGLLQLLLIGLKLADVITWSWWLVLLPTWVGLGLTVFVLLFVATAFSITRSKPPKFYRDQHRRR